MFTAKVCSNIREATEYSKKLLAELETTRELEFQVVLSSSETECCEAGGDWDHTSCILLNAIREMDMFQGYMMYDRKYGGFWDFVEWEVPNKKRLTPDPDEWYVTAGEKLVVIHNVHALCEDQFPIVIVKESFWNNHGDQCLKMLKVIEPGIDYTTKISPAVYVELFFAE